MQYFSKNSNNPEELKLFHVLRNAQQRQKDIKPLKVIIPVIKIKDKDREWLEQEPKNYTFDGEDEFVKLVQQLLQVADDLKEDRKGGNDEADDDAVELAFEELTELIENAPQNTLTLCRMGGMTMILTIIWRYPGDIGKQKACIF